jgi:uncharacterized protein (DUF736 family)
MTTNIGSVQRDGDGYVGTLETLAFKAPLEILPSGIEGEKAPDFRVFSGGREIGAAWSLTSKKGTGYLSLKISDPALGAFPIYPAFVAGRTRGSFTLLLNGRGQ